MPSHGIAGEASSLSVEESQQSCTDYDLIDSGDRIAVAVCGGKTASRFSGCGARAVDLPNSSMTLSLSTSGQLLTVMEASLLKAWSTFWKQKGGIAAQHANALVEVSIYAAGPTASGALGPLGRRFS